MEREKLQMLKDIGFFKEVQNVSEGKCPFCGKVVDPNGFRDKLSAREFENSGLCQECQDKMFF